MCCFAATKYNRAEVVGSVMILNFFCLRRTPPCNSCIIVNIGGSSILTIIPFRHYYWAEGPPNFHNSKDTVQRMRSLHRMHACAAKVHHRFRTILLNTASPNCGSCDSNSDPSSRTLAFTCSLSRLNTKAQAQYGHSVQTLFSDHRLSVVPPMTAYFMPPACN